MKITGSRKRQIPLNDQIFEALAKWSKERPASRSSAFFVTNKGKVKELSDRAVDKLIRKYADQAGVKRKVNAQILRNTFAVRLFQENITFAKASEILGISDPQSISRYINAAKKPLPKLEQKDVEKLDTRPAVVKIISKAFPTKPKVAKALTAIKGAIVAPPEEVIFCREHVVAEIKQHIGRNESVLAVGQLGIGKTHLLKHLTAKLSPDALYISFPSPLKNMLGQICDRVAPDWRKKVKTRASTKELMDYLIRQRTANNNQKTVIIIDNLNTLKASEIEPLLLLLDNFTIIGAADETVPRLKQIWWKFIKVELKPLNNDTAKELIKYLTQNLSVSDYELLETRVLSLSNGLPLAIVDMVHQVSHKPVVNREAIREVYHEAGIHYRDWTSALVVLWGMAIMFRFIALGTHSFESYILAGMGIAFLSIMRFFAFRMR